MLMCHELNDFHKSDSQMGAAQPNSHPHSSSLSSSPHLQASLGLRQVKCQHLEINPCPTPYGRYGLKQTTGGL